MQPPQEFPPSKHCALRLAVLAITMLLLGCETPESDSPHPITTPEWMRGDWVGPLPDDGSDPARVAVTAHEIRFKGSLPLEALSVPHSEAVVSITTARSTNHEYKLALLTTEGEVDLLFRRLEGDRLLIAVNSPIPMLTASAVFARAVP